MEQDNGNEKKHTERGSWSMLESRARTGAQNLLYHALELEEEAYVPAPAQQRESGLWYAIASIQSER